MSRTAACARPRACLALLVLALAGCAGQQASASSSPSGQRAALAAYMRHIEPLRLAVNRLLEGADPILSAHHDGRLSARAAAAQMGALERRFAAYAVQITAIVPASAQLRELQAIYAHTYVLEDSYLSSLVLGLGEGDLDGLPNTESIQRQAIIQWRIGLEVMALRTGYRLPADLRVAGRGEIRPSPQGS